MLTHEELKKKMLNNPDMKAEYDALEKEFTLFDELLNARMQAGLTQAEVADRMGTKTPAIARLEARRWKQTTFSLNIHAPQIRRSSRLSLGDQTGTGLSSGQSLTRIYSS